MKTAWLGVLIAGAVGACRTDHGSAPATPSVPAPIRSSSEDQAMTEPIPSTEAEWRQALTDEQYRILREKATEPRFTGEYNDHHGDGVYRCAGCGQALFDSDTKYDSKSGWPSFHAPIAADAVREEEDRSVGMVRAEVLCKRCGGHLGHRFPDGPQPTFQRYCINSAALLFDADESGR